MDFEVASPPPPDSDEAPVFVLSFRQRDELATAASSAGWRVVAARRGEGVESRFLSSGAGIAVVDARGALSDGLIAARSLGAAVEANGAAMLILVSQSDTIHLREFYEAGATHFLSSPMSIAAIGQAMRFAARHAERLGQGHSIAADAGSALGWRWDATTRALQLTPELAKALGLDEAPGLRAALATLLPRDRKRARAAFRRLNADAPSTAFAHDTRAAGRVVQHLQRHADGSISAIVERLAAPETDAAVREALGAASDGPGARRWLDHRLEAGEAVCALLVGLPGFDSVNTAYGRGAGDALLRAVSRRIAQAARETLGQGAVAARIAGSEFLVAVPAVDDATVETTRARIEAVMARPFVVEGALIPLGARVAAVRSEPGDSTAALLRRAGEALRDDGGPGRDGPDLDLLAAQIRRALDRGEIEILFQPQVSIATHAIVGAEALARWRHREHGELGAEILLAAAERAGLSHAVGDHIHSLALEAAARWPAALSGLRLSINVTAGDVARTAFADILLGRVDSSRFPRNRLTVEITESGIMRDLGEAARLLGQLRSAGCRVAIDDFGTGYSSLAYLKALPLDYLKIDKRLSQDIAGSPRDRVVVRGVIDMARSLGLAVIAEGVETEQQLDLLAKEGCQYYQGFLCAGPVDSEALAGLAEGVA